MSDLGLRERKKLRTREAIRAAAEELFLDRGYEGVTVAEVARAADVSVATVFSYFPDGKEALVFGTGENRPTVLAEALDARAAGSTVLGALESFILERGPFQEGAALAPVQRLISETAPLRSYAQRQWAACEPVLVAALAREAAATDDIGLHALARYALQVPDIASRAPDPAAVVSLIMSRLAAGWARDSTA